MPEGFAYFDNVISIAAQEKLAAWIATLPLKPFEFRGYEGKRRVTSFGYRYDYGQHALQTAAPIPEPLLELRRAVASFANRAADDFRQVLVTEYSPGAAIGWHRDRPQFGAILGVSLLAAANFRLRRRDGDR